jgi:hypothetical protein
VSDPSRQETTQLVYTALELVKDRDQPNLSSGFEDGATTYDIDGTLIRVGTIYDLGVRSKIPPVLVSIDLLEDQEVENDNRLAYSQTSFWFWSGSRGRYPYRERYVQINEHLVLEHDATKEFVNIAGVGALAALNSAKMSRSTKKRLRAEVVTKFDRQRYAKLFYFLTSCKPENIIEAHEED